MPIHRSELPVGWGADHLSKFQALAQNNEISTYVQLTLVFGMVSHVDTVFHQSSEYCLKQINRVDNSIPFLLFLNAHNHYRGSLRLVNAGQCLPCYATGRSTVETALYGWYLSTDPELLELWHNRPDPFDRNQNRIWSNTFKFSTMINKVREFDSALADRLKYIHQLAINFGAHPNTDALYSNIEMSNLENGDTLIKMNYLHNWGYVFAHAIKFIVEVGLVSLELLNLMDTKTNDEFALSNQRESLQLRYERLRPILEATLV